MNNFKELSANEMLEVNGGGLPTIAKVTAACIAIGTGLSYAVTVAAAVIVAKSKSQMLIAKKKVQHGIY